MVHFNRAAETLGFPSVAEFVNIQFKVKATRTAECTLVCRAAGE